MSSLDLYGPPPTKAKIAEARSILEEQESSVKSLSDQIEHARDELKLLIKQSEDAIKVLEEKKRKVEKEAEITLAYISPLRRLPNDILREVFYHVFDTKPYAAWVLASVCSSWRRLVLGMPNLWSKIRWTTSLNHSPDTIRLWLERSSSKIPLDIEIHLKVPQSINRRGSGNIPPPAVWTPGSPAWGMVPAPPSPIPDIYVPPPPAEVVGVDDDAPFDGFAPIPGGWGAHVVHPPIGLAQNPPASSSRLPRDKAKKDSRTAAEQWAHVAMFYLIEQMHRWKRFIFKYDRHFPSAAALKAISGDAPLLEEFEVTNMEVSFAPMSEQPQIPFVNLGKSPNTNVLEKLHTLSLQSIPFRLSSAAISVTGLKSLTLRGLTNSSVAMDRLFYIIDNNRTTLTHLSLSFSAVQHSVIPLPASGATLPELKSMHLSGSYLLPGLVDALTTPAIESLSLEFEQREPIEEALASLLTRSGGPPLTKLTLGHTNPVPYYGGPAGGFSSTNAWAFLAGAPTVIVLNVSQSSFDPIMNALSKPTSAPSAGTLSDDEDDDGPLPGPAPIPDDVPVGGGPIGVGNPVGGVGGNGGGVVAADIEPGTWLVPQLEKLVLRGCATTSSSTTTAVQKLVKLVQERNPILSGNGNVEGTAGIEPHLVRLKTLELHDCVHLSENVLKWLKERVSDVKYSEPTFSRRGARSPSYFM